ncbi:hypothetical protein [Rhizobium sp. BK491]|nr:hypothetical protein [Rhizobium sp. BK491]MBB3571611.1 hypothetical protein [Rhizobium sp. BK491]
MRRRARDDLAIGYVFYLAKHDSALRFHHRHFPEHSGRDFS